MGTENPSVRDFREWATHRREEATHGREEAPQLREEALQLRESSTTHTNGASSVFLLTWEHGAKVSKNPESPKSPSKIPCLSGFQASHTLGNVKTAEVRTRKI